MTRCASEANFPVDGLGWTAPERIPCRLETERLIIRGYEIEDAPAMYEAIDQSRGHLQPWMPWEKLHTGVTATTRYAAEQNLALDAGPKFDNVGIGIFEKSSGRFLGGTGVHDVRRDTASCEMGYWIRADAIGKGFASEAAARVISWALADQSAAGLGLRRVRVYCSGANVPSQRVVEKLGIRREVCQRDDYYIPTIGPTDRLGWGVMAHEWDTVSHCAINPTA